MAVFSQGISGALSSWFGDPAREKESDAPPAAAHEQDGDSSEHAPLPAGGHKEAGGLLEPFMQGSSMSGLFGHFAEMATAHVGAGAPRGAEKKGGERGAREKKREQLHKKGVDEAKAAAQMIGADYLKNSPAINPEKPVGKLDSKEARLAFLAQLTQNDDTNPRSEHYCGSTTLIAGAIYAKGTQGLMPLIAQIKSTLRPGESTAKELEELEKKLASGSELQMTDIQLMQSTLYAHLKRKQNADPTLSQQSKDNDGIDGKVIQDFMRGDPEVKKMFMDNKMNINFIDSAGKGDKNHFVLNINDPNRQKGDEFGPSAPLVYDPYSRKGGQLVTESDQLEDYRKTTQRAITPE